VRWRCINSISPADGAILALCWANSLPLETNGCFGRDGLAGDDRTDACAVAGRTLVAAAGGGATFPCCPLLVACISAVSLVMPVQHVSGSRRSLTWRATVREHSISRRNTTMGCFHHRFSSSSPWCASPPLFVPATPRGTACVRLGRRTAAPCACSSPSAPHAFLLSCRKTHLALFIANAD